MKLITKVLFSLSLLCAGAVNATEFTDVYQGDKNFKKLKMAVAIKESEKDANMYSVNLTIGLRILEGNKLSYLHISKPVRYSEGKNGSLVRSFKDSITIKPKILDDAAVFSFELDKNEIKKSELDFCYFKGREPLVRYRLLLNAYVE